MQNVNKKFILSFVVTVFLLAGFCAPKYIEAARVENYKEGEVLVKLKNRDRVYNLELKDEEGVDEAVERVSDLDSVEYVEPNYLYKASLEPLDTYYTQQIYLSQTRANLAWDMVHDSPRVVIAVIDTGVDIDHPDLVDNIWYNKDEIVNNGVDDDGDGLIDDMQGWDFVENVPDPHPKYGTDYSKDGMNHGTIVAAVAAAKGGNGEGVVGVTWSAQIMPLRVLDGTGVGDTLSVARAIDYAIYKGADIINLSFVGDGSSQTLEDAIKRAWEKGILVVAAAGNEIRNGVDLSTNPRYPVNHDGTDGENWVLGVASVDKNEVKGSFSNFSDKYIDVSAPGVGIFSALFYDSNNPMFDKEYGGNWAGTSVSAPQVSATAALIKAVNPKISLGELQKILITSGDDIDRYNKPWAGQLGKRLNVYQAILKAKESVQDDYQGTDLITGTVKGGGPHLRLFRENNLVSEFFAFDTNTRGGVNPVIADLDGDGIEEIVVGAGFGMLPEIKIFDTKGNFKRKFSAYDHKMTSGLRLAIGDADGDGEVEIIAAPGEGNQPYVKIFDELGGLKNQFLVFNEDFLGGVELATADTNHDGKDEIIVGLGPGTIPGVRVYDSLGNFKTQFFPYNINFKGGVRVATGDVDNDGEKEIITGPGQGGGPHVRVFNLDGSLRSQFFALDKNDRGGLFVAAGDVDNDGRLEIIVGTGKGRQPEVKVFDLHGKMEISRQVYGDNYRLGVRVAAGE